MGFQTQPSTSEHLDLSFPQPRVLLVRIAREKQLNALTPKLQQELSQVFDWFDEEPSCWVAVLTGTGKTFCVGRDLKTWLASVTSSSFSPIEETRSYPNGFGGVSTRSFKKPLIIALNGHCLGGGAEMALNGDIIIGYSGITFGFPEVKRGVAARLGGIPALFRSSPVLVPYLLAGIPIPQALLSTHIFSTTVPTAADVLPEALRWANILLQASPDAVRATRDQLKHAKELDREIVSRSAHGEAQKVMYEGANFREGLRAFQEKRDPIWSNPGKSSKL